MHTSSRFRFALIAICALATMVVATDTFAAVDAYLTFKASDGKVIKTKVKGDGTFMTPSLSAGNYTVTLTLGNGKGTAGTGNSDRESSAPSVSEITMNAQEVMTKDAASGLPTGKRMHKPIVITKSVDRATPLLAMPVGSVTVDTTGDALTGRLILKSA